MSICQIFAMYMMIFQSEVKLLKQKLIMESLLFDLLFQPIFLIIILGGRTLIIFWVPDPPLDSTFVSLSFVKYVDFQTPTFKTRDSNI